MASKLAGNHWGEILHHPADRILELRWLPVTMSDGGFKATLALLSFGPWLKAQARAEALTWLLWTQVFRYVALQIFSAQQFGFAVSDSGRDQIAYGDVAGTILALFAIIALRYRLGIATVLTWAVVVETLFDLANATLIGVREQPFAKAFGTTWF